MCEKIKIKKCTKCGKESPATIEYFCRNGHHKDGLDGFCKKCKAKITKDRNELNKSLPKEKECNECGRKLNIRKDFNIDKSSPDDHLNICKKCQDKKTELKTCTKCKREFPATENYFNKDKYNEDGLTYQCKECRTGNVLFNTKKPKEGYKFCIKCNRELLNTIVFFPPDDTCSDSFRNVCRECGKDGHFMEDDYTPIKWWSHEENELFIKRYQYYTSLELIELFYPNETMKSLSDRAYKLGCNGKTEDVKMRANTHKKIVLSQKLKGLPKSDEHKRKLSETRKKMYKTGQLISPWKGRVVTDEEKQRISQRVKGKWVGKNNPRVSDPLVGERNGRWEGGIKELYSALRDNISEWKEASMVVCDYKCVLTGDSFDNIHHLVPFKKIVNEIFDVLELPRYQTIGDYTNEEYILIIDKLKELHKKYGLGVCLKKELHKLFHDTYGYLNNTPEQFEEFKIRYFNHEFDEILKKAI